LSPFGGGRGGGWETRKQETGDRRRFQTFPSNVQNIHPRSAEADHPRQRWTIGMRFRAFCYTKESIKKVFTDNGSLETYNIIFQLMNGLIIFIELSIT
jgi:hypothetical protein